MNKMINYGSLAFITVIVIMAVVSLLGVWEVLVDDVIEKSLITVGFLALIGVIIAMGYRFMNPDATSEETQVNDWRPMFKQIRSMSLTVMIGTTGILGLLGIMGIWEILDEDFFWKALASISIIAVSAAIIAIICFEREGRGLVARVVHNREGEFSFWRAILLFILLIWILPAIFWGW